MRTSKCIASGWRKSAEAMEPFEMRLGIGFEIPFGDDDHYANPFIKEPEALGHADEDMRLEQPGAGRRRLAMDRRRRLV